MHPEAVEGLLEERVLAEGDLSLETPTAVGANTHAGRGKESARAKPGSWGVSAKSSCQRHSLTFHRFAACLAKVVRCTRKRFGKKKWA